MFRNYITIHMYGSSYLLYGVNLVKCQSYILHQWIEQTTQTSLCCQINKHSLVNKFITFFSAIMIVQNDIPIRVQFFFEFPVILNEIPVALNAAYLSVQHSVTFLVFHHACSCHSLALHALVSLRYSTPHIQRILVLKITQ